MDGSDEPALPHGYPDAAVVGWIRTDELEAAGVHIRMTVTPGQRIVELWELAEGHPVRWIGNVYRIDADLPALRVTYGFESRFNRYQREALARAAAKFWKS